MDKLVKRISHFILKYDPSFKNSKEILEYSITLFLESFIVLISFVCLSLVFHQLESGLLFISTLVTVRNFFGGGHASNFKSCFCISNFAFVMGLLLVLNLKQRSIFMIVLLLIVSVFLYTMKSDHILKNLSFSILVIASILMVLVNIQLGYYLIVSCFLTALADLLFKKVGEKNEKENAIRKTS
ncbi:accessory gene regulator B family protein [Enterococcus sp. AZ163]|uniref:accessory gene regulator B family protein n=1 Tax=Enterococcus sp. AZ163 TaxID=2774638 RepID=UPI003D286AEA